MTEPEIGDMIMKDGKVLVYMPFYDPQTGTTRGPVWADADLEGKYTVKPTATEP